jgi:hypothetical protein
MFINESLDTFQQWHILILIPKLTSAALVICVDIILSDNYWLSIPVGSTIVLT